MAKLFETSDEIVEIIENEFDKVGLLNYGINLKVISTTKSKDIIKVSKASATTEFLSKKSDIVIFTVYEEAFDRLSDKIKKLLIDMAMSNVYFDSAKDKLVVDSSPYNQLFAIREKYGCEDVLNALELSYHIIAEIEEEAKAKKQAEKEAKKNKTE